MIRRDATWLIALVVLAGDAASKWWATGAVRSPRAIAPGIRFEVVANPGASFSWGTQLPLVVHICASLLTVAVLLAALIVQPGLPTLALGLVLGGAAGNLADRLGGIHRVIDFIHVGNWFVCNVADVAITSGLVMMAYQILRGRKILQ